MKHRYLADVTVTYKGADYDSLNNEIEVDAKDATDGQRRTADPLAKAIEKCIKKMQGEYPATAMKPGIEIKIKLKPKI